MARIVALSLACCTLLNCSKNQPVSVNKFSDPVFITIADLQDRRLSDSLYQYFKNPNEAYRRDAVLAFASIQDTTAVDKLGNVLLNDASIEVKRAAAFALGQTPSLRSEDVLTQALAQAPETIKDEIFEALGKVYRDDNAYTTLSASGSPGMAWGAYRLATRRLGQNVVNNCLQYLQDKSNTTRIGAAHFFSRSSFLFEVTKNASLQQLLISAALKDSLPEVRMACALALRKLPTDSTRIALHDILVNEQDYRVRVGAVRALQAFSFAKSKDDLVNALNDTNINVAIAASEAIKSIVTKELGAELIPVAKQQKNFRVQANLYEAILSVTENKSLQEEIEKAISAAINPYHKAALITALQSSVSSTDFIKEQLLKADTPAVKLAAASALVTINQKKKGDLKFNQQMAKIYKTAMGTGDAAVIGTIAGTLADSTYNYKKLFPDFTFLYEAKKKLSLPKDNEALQPLEAAIAYFEGKKNPPAISNAFNNPIDWNLVKGISRDQKAIIKTTKGEITLRLLVEEAPGSVANFVKLVNQNYFNKKFFHRVVPNFVVQAGCNRGDGWGSEDYSIRSEFSMRRYTTGSVGMASAGKDTEGTQWFITHSPTPHLDGRYTLFAVVESGMDAVHQLEVGDMIEDVKLVK